MANGSAATSSSMTDILASLVAVFVLLFVAAQNNRGAGVVTARDALVRQLRGTLKAAGIDSAAVKPAPNDPATALIILPDSVLFDRGASEMSGSGKNFVRSATPLLADAFCVDSTRQKLDQVVVEGHTDNTIPRGELPEAGRMFNLKLSQQRSMDFVLVSTASLAGNKNLGCYLALISATGRGQEDPLPKIPADSAPNRRVVLRIRLRTEIRDSLKLLPTLAEKTSAKNP